MPKNSVQTVQSLCIKAKPEFRLQPNDTCSQDTNTLNPKALSPKPKPCSRRKRKAASDSSASRRSSDFFGPPQPPTCAAPSRAVEARIWYCCFLTRAPRRSKVESSGPPKPHYVSEGPWIRLLKLPQTRRNLRFRALEFRMGFRLRKILFIGFGIWDLSLRFLWLEPGRANAEFGRADLPGRQGS